MDFTEKIAGKDITVDLFFTIRGCFDFLCLDERTV
jgi:hypothetical protein